MNISIPNNFVAATVAQSAQVNANFTAIATAFNTYAVQTDVSRTITASPTFAADILFTDALYDIGKSGATRPRDGFFSRNVVVGGTLGVTGLITATAGVQSAGFIRAAYADPRFSLINSAAGPDEKNWDILASGTQLFFRTLNDSNTAPVTAFVITRVGTAINAVTFTANINVTTGGITITGNSTITGTLSGVTTLTATTVVANLTGNVTGNVSGTAPAGSLTGTTLAANVVTSSLTSVDTLTALTVSGNVTLTAAASRILGGATSFAIRNAANSADNLIITDAGASTIRTALTVTTGFGCNGATPQTAFVSGGAMGAYGAGANGYASAGGAQALWDMVTNIRLALVADGVMS